MVVQSDDTTARQARTWIPKRYRDRREVHPDDTETEGSDRAQSHTKRHRGRHEIYSNDTAALENNQVQTTASERSGKRAIITEPQLEVSLVKKERRRSISGRPVCFKIDGLGFVRVCAVSLSHVVRL